MKKKIKVAVQLAVLVTAIGVVAFQSNKAYAAMEDYMAFVEEVDAAELANHEKYLSLENEGVSDSVKAEAETYSAAGNTKEDKTSSSKTTAEADEDRIESVEETEEFTSEEAKVNTQPPQTNVSEDVDAEELDSEDNTKSASAKVEQTETAAQTEAPTTVAQTEAPTTEAPTTAAPTPAPTEAPTTVAPTPAPAPAISIDSVGGFNQEIKNAFKALGFNVTVTGGVPYAGVFSPSRRIIDLNANAANQASLLHEIGHFVSFLKIGAADTAEFIDIYNAERGAYTGGNAGYVTSTQGEYFAESFRDFVENPAGLQASRPRTYEYVARIANSINANDVAVVRATYGI